MTGTSSPVSSAMAVIWRWPIASSTRLPAKRGIQGVVVVSNAQVGLRRDTRTLRSAGRYRHRLWQRAHALSLFDQALGGNGADATMKAGVGTLSKPARRAGPGSPGGSRSSRRAQNCAHEPVGALEDPLPRDRALEGFASRPPGAPQKAAKSSVGAPPPSWIAPSRSQTIVSGRAPSDERQRSCPRRDPERLEKTRAPAAALDQPSSQLTT